MENNEKDEPEKVSMKSLKESSQSSDIEIHQIDETNQQDDLNQYENNSDEKIENKIEENNSSKSQTKDDQLNNESSFEKIEYEQTQNQQEEINQEDQDKKKKKNDRITVRFEIDQKIDEKDQERDNNQDNQSNDANEGEIEFDNLSLKSDEKKQKQEEEIQQKQQMRRQTTMRCTRTTTIRQTEIINQNSFDYLKKLGQGSYGTVYLVRKKDTQHLYALKQLEKQHILKFGKINSVLRERDTLEQLCECKNIIKLDCTFQDEKNLYFLMEYAEKGSIESIIKNNKCLPIETCRYFVAEIVLALEYMHSKNICHRDLKPDNILLDSNFHVKICDFGEAKIMGEQDQKKIDKYLQDFEKQQIEEKKNDEEVEDLQVQVYVEGEEFGDDNQFDRDSMFQDIQRQPQLDSENEEDPFDEMFQDDENLRQSQYQEKDDQKQRSGTFVGTALWVSPEMLNGSIGAPFNDLWSLGVIIYQILAGEAPWKRFNGDNTTEYMIYQYIRERRIEFPNNMPLEAVDLIDKLLQLNPSKRLGAGLKGSDNDYESLKNHKFFNGLNFKRIEQGQIAPPIPQDLIRQLEIKENDLEGDQEDDLGIFNQQLKEIEQRFSGFQIVDENEGHFKTEQKQLDQLEDSDPQFLPRERKINTLYQKQTVKKKKMQIMYEGNVEIIKQRSILEKNKFYYMVLTNQPRLFLYDEFKIVNDMPIKQEYRKDILLHNKMKVQLLKKNVFRMHCPFGGMMLEFKVGGDSAGDWVKNINEQCISISSTTI